MEIKAKEIKIEPIEKIVPNPKNANIHSEEQLERLSKLVDFQGFRVPLIVSNRTGFLVAGHGRLEMAKRNNIKELPVIYQDFESEAQEYAFLISDNEIARWAELDYQKMEVELAELPELDRDLLALKIDLSNWESDIDALDKIKENLDGIMGKIKITCPQEIKDEVLIYIKAKLLETSFEGVHIE